MSQDFAKKTSSDRSRNASRNNEAETISNMKPFAFGTIFGIIVCLVGQQIFTGQFNEELADPLESVPTIEEATGPVLDFYTRLREVEVLVPDEALVPTSQNLIYLLQAGSFRKAEDADSMRVQLILLNLDAEISKFNHNGEIWHRVIVGPFEDRSTMAKTRTTLLENGIESLLLTQEVEG